MEYIDCTLEIIEQFKKKRGLDIMLMPSPLSKHSPTNKGHLSLELVESHPMNL
jgi:hypothetical protein